MRTLLRALFSFCKFLFHLFLYLLLVPLAFLFGLALSKTESKSSYQTSDL